MAFPVSLSEEIRVAVEGWSRGQRDLVHLAARFADSDEWVIDGSPTAAHWLAAVADVETCTAREWIRIGRLLGDLPLISAAYASADLSYSKVRALTRVASVDNEAELLAIALDVPAGALGRHLAAWVGRNTDPADLEDHQHQARSVTWRLEPDGMTVFTLRLPPLLASMLIVWLTTWVMRTRSERDASVGFPTVAQQHADALEALVGDGAGDVSTEIVVHVRGDGCAMDDGTPVPDTVVERLAPQSFLRALIHDARARPVNASGRRRHPTTRQKRVVKERDRVCRDCGRRDLLHYDHQPPFEQTQHTHIDELELRCAPCHRNKHAAP